MKKIIQAIIAGIGIGSLFRGWQYFRTDLPKPTEEEKVTRIDYLSGDYQEALRERESKLQQSRMQGKWYLVAGTALLAGGVSILTSAVIEELQKSASSTKVRENNSTESKSVDKESMPDLSA